MKRGWRHKTIISAVIRRWGCMQVSQVLCLNTIPGAEAGSLDQREQLLNSPSISMAFLMRVFIFFTPASQRPPKWGDRLGENFYSIFWTVVKEWTTSWVDLLVRRLWRSWSFRFAPTKLVPLSDKIVAGQPLLSVNRGKINSWEYNTIITRSGVISGN